MRIVLIGGGGIGYALAEALSLQHDIFVIDSNPGRADRFAQLDIEFVHGSGTNPAVLRRAATDRADLLIAATGLDEVNIVACSIATQLGKCETICFVGKEDLLQTSGGSDSLRKHFGIGRVVWPEAQLADAIERIIMAPGALDAAAFADGRIELLEFRVDQDSPFVQRPIAALDLPPSVVIAAARHEDSISIPRGGSQLAGGDRVIAMGTREGMAQLRQRVLPAAAASVQRVTIVGGGDVGYRLAQQLDQVKGMQLRVIERSRARGELIAAGLRHTLVLNGDGTDLGLLEAEEIGRSDVMVSVIDNDERNLFASLLGRQLGVGKIITRVSKQANLRLFERVGVDVALSARGAAVTSVIHQIDGGRASLLAVLEEGQAKVVELTVPAGYPATALKDLELPSESIVSTLLRGGDVVVPGGQDVVRAGDRLLVCCTDAAVADVRDAFSSTAP